MSFYNNKEHFLHTHLTFLESSGIQGENDGFENFLLERNIPATGANYMINKTCLDWTKVNPHYKFFYDYEGGEKEIRDWLNKSELSKHKYLFTYLSYGDPVIKVKTSDFINNWEEFNLATGWDGLILTTEKGDFFLEFAESPRDLHSNFKIKP